MKVSFYIFLLFVLIIVIAPRYGNAQTNSEQYFQAKVINIIDEVTKTREDGSKYIQQHLELEVIQGKEKGKHFEINNIGDLDVVNSNHYKKGDKVLVLYDKSTEGEDYYQIVDSIRTGPLFWLSLVFALVLILVAKFKGLKSLLGLALSFVVIMEFIVPQIMDGANPLLIGIIGSLFILFLLIYLTEGWTRVSHISFLAIFISLFITGLLSVFFTNLTKLTGMAGDEVMYLIGAGRGVIDFKGMLLAGILIGTLGVLDDLVVSQVSLVKEIQEANPNLSKKEVYKKSMRVGVTHIGAMTNTLFLAYAGVSLPLLMLFTVKNPPFLDFSDVINNELIATEIVRTLVGSVGLVLSVPIATILAVNFFKKRSRD